jgi:hypothetical protein
MSIGPPRLCSAELQGECEGATHFVDGLAVGAFDFRSGGEAQIGGNAGVGNAGAGAHSRRCSAAPRVGRSLSADYHTCGISRYGTLWRYAS